MRLASGCKSTSESAFQDDLRFWPVAGRHARGMNRFKKSIDLKDTSISTYLVQRPVLPGELNEALLQFIGHIQV